MKLPRFNFETRISLYYLLFGGLWILLSDRLLMFFFSDPVQLTAIQTYKGWLFVTASALLVYYLLRHYLAIQRRLDAELHENEERYRLLFNTSLDAIFLSRPDGNIIEANPAACQVFGWTATEFRTMGRAGLLDTTDPRLNAALEERVRTGRFSGELTFVRKDGSKFPGEISTVLFNDSKGREQSNNIIRDITERKDAEERLRLLSFALESAGNAIVITNRDGVIEWVNSAYESLTGYPKEEVIGQNSRILKSGVHMQPFYKDLWDTIAAGKVWCSELINKRKNGSLYTEEETISPLLDSHGNVSYFIGIKQDITDRKQAEKQLRESEERLRLALYVAQQGIYDLNVQTGEAIVTDMYASMLGYDPGTFKENNFTWFERLHPDDRESTGQLFNDYLQGKIPEYRAEFRLKTASVDWIWILSIGRIVEYDGEGRPLRMLGTHTDITESKNTALKIGLLLDESQRRLQRIESLHQIDIAISSNYNLTTTLDILLEQVKRQLVVDTVAILLFDVDGKAFQYTTSQGIEASQVLSTPIPPGSSLAGIVAQKGELVKKSGIEAPTDPNLTALLASLYEAGFQDYYGIPLKAKGRLIGVLELFHRSTLNPDAEWISYYETLAGQAAVAIENAQLIESLRHANDELIGAYDATIEGWSMAMDLRDRETEGHTQRVTEMTVALARKMNISEADIIHFRRGALLHDIGKMGIPDSILLKPALLTDEERKIMQRHPKYAFDMLQSIDYLRLALEIPHYHHEKWDGTGYPYGLRAEQIPLSARLFAMIDVYDALTSDRPYRKAWSKQETIQYILEQSGKHFDPGLVSIFILDLDIANS